MQSILRSYGSLICPGDWQVAGVFDFCRLYYIRGGHAVYEDTLGSEQLESGTIYIFPAYVPYTIKHDPDSPLDVLWFHANLIAVRHSKLLKDRIASGSLQNHLIQALTGCQTTPTSLVDKLFDALCESIGLQASLPEASQPTMQKVFDMICQQDKWPLHNREMAARLGYSEKYFNRLFLKTAGLQPHKFVVLVRMAQAAKYLCGGKTIGETACLLGYSSANNFSRDFKAHYHISPRQYAASNTFWP